MFAGRGSRGSSARLDRFFHRIVIRLLPLSTADLRRELRPSGAFAALHYGENCGMGHFRPRPPQKSGFGAELPRSS
jgi:hypothetical protein